MTSTIPATHTIAIRLATAEDGDAMQRLAALDSKRVPAGPTLVAERDGIVHAALDLWTGDVVADPFVATTELVALLQFRAQRLRAAAAERRRFGFPRRRVARALAA